jgi:hypothetical protein
VDSEELTAPVDSAKVNKNEVGAYWEITWIRKSWQPLLTQQKPTKMKSVPTRKSSPKHRPKVTGDWEDLANWSQRKRSRSRMENHHRNTLQWWRADSKAFAAPVDSEKVNETSSKGDSWIRQRPQP